jgi:pteridine reductase
MNFMTPQQTFGCPHPVALVTGSGAPRVGRAIAHRLAAAGCHIAVHANRSIAEAEEVASELCQRYGASVLVTQGSLDDEGNAERIVRQTFEHFGRLDIAVNSAAIWKPTPLDQITADEIRRYFEINTIACFLIARAAGSIMIRQPTGGAIVNIGDWATVRPYLDHAAYFPSKGAVEVMTRSLAVELAHRNPNIRVNCVQPGPVLLADDVDEMTIAKIAASTLVGRVGTAEAVAHAVECLCVNNFITGTCLVVDGGRSIYAADGLQVGINLG